MASGTDEISWWQRRALSVKARKAADAAVSSLPHWFLRGFFKTFITRQSVAEASGFHVHPRRFDSALPLIEEIDLPKLNQRRVLPGIDLRTPQALALIGELGRFTAELDSIPYDADGKSAFWFNNQTFTDFDASVLYSLLRYLKPKRYIELGCGFSSMISSLALFRNGQESSPPEVIFVDPHPNVEVTGHLACGKLVTERVQALPLEIFKNLEPNDVLFIDTSHVLKVQSDVETELLRILPSLAPGVWIHVHDVFTPYDYPEEWITRPLRLTYNEQYAVECLLTGGTRYQVEIPLHCLVREHPLEMKKFFPRGLARGQSIWLRKIAVT